MVNGWEREGEGSIPLDDQPRDNTTNSVAHHSRDEVRASNGIGCASGDLEIQRHGKHKLLSLDG